MMFEASWNGTDGQGKVVSPGTYIATLTVKNSDGCSATATLPVTVTQNESSCELYVQIGSTANVASGALTDTVSLFRQPQTHLMPEFKLYYSSIRPNIAPLGTGWSHTYDIAFTKNNNNTYSLMEQGSITTLYQNGAVYTPQNAAYPKVTINADGSASAEFKSGRTYSFNAAGNIAAITDRNANTTTFTHDAAGNLTAVADATGRKIIFTYTANQISTITDLNNNLYSMTYTAGMLTGITRQAPSATATQIAAYSYDAQGFLLGKTDSLGNTTTYTYNADHKISGSTDPYGRIRAITYNPFAAETVYTDKDSGIWTYRYDTILGVLKDKIDPLGNKTTYTYDANGNLLTETDSEGEITSYTYDANSNLLTETDSLGNITTYTYNSFNKVISITDPLGNKTTYTYDANGNLLSKTDPTAGITAYTYDTKGNILSITDPKGLKTTITYDQYNNPVTITQPNGAVTKNTYDIMGNLLTSTDPIGKTTTYIYNSFNQLIKTIDPLGAITTYTYDAAGNRTTQTDGNSNTTSYEYNYRGQPIEITDAIGNITTMTYGGAGCGSCGSGGGIDKLTSITDSNANTTVFTYDQADRLIKEVDPMGSTKTYTYDALGNLLTSTDAKGNTIIHTYDSIGRLLQKKYPDGTTTAYQYDAAGRVIYAGNQHSAYNMQYDSLGRLTAVTDNAARTIIYTYDKNGNRLSMIDPAGGTTTYTYNNLNQITAIKDPSVRIHTINYDAMGRRTAFSQPNGVQTTYTYDAASNIQNILSKKLATTINTNTYTYDKAGNRTTNQSQYGTYTYTYDKTYQLTQAAHTNLPVETYTYDKTGNRAATITDKANRLLDDGTNTYTYDADGNLTTKTNKYTSEVITYTWDYEGRLIKVIMLNGLINTYKYDPFGRRVEKNVNGTVIKYVYDNEDILFEYNNAGVLEARYTHGPGVDEPLSMERAGQLYYYHADGLGSVAAITDASGDKMLEFPDYKSFGLSATAMHSEFVQPYAFTGRELDQETGLYYYRARYYDANTGRFISKDPIGFSAGDVNLYRYVGNNPVNWVDPWGLWRVHGKWCGPNWTAGMKGPYNYVYYPPDDDLDECCMMHDICFHECRQKHPCDQVDRKECMVECNKKLSACSGKSSVKGSIFIKWWMSIDDVPSIGPNAGSCNLNKQKK